MFMLSTDQIAAGIKGLWGVPAYEWVVRHARKRGLAGATVLRGVYGFGSRGLAPKEGWHVAHGLPLVVEIVDSGEAVGRFYTEEVGPHLKHGMVTLERAVVMRYRGGRGAAGEENKPMDIFKRVQDFSTLPTIGGSDAMTMQSDGVLLRVFVGDADKFEGAPLYEAVVKKARELGLAGATVLKGTMGFGAHSVLHTAKVMELSEDLPMVVEVVDSEEKVRKLLAEVDGMVKEGMITMEGVRVVAWRKG
jgi:PII-like signaling protein